MLLLQQLGNTGTGVLSHFSTWMLQLGRHKQGRLGAREKGSWKFSLSEKTDLPFDLQAQHCSSCFTTPERNPELLTSMEVYKSLPGLCVLTT